MLKRIAFGSVSLWKAEFLVLFLFRRKINIFKIGWFVSMILKKIAKFVCWSDQLKKKKNNLYKFFEVF